MEAAPAAEAAAAMETAAMEAATMSTTAVAATVTAAPGVSYGWKRNGASRERKSRGADYQQSLEIQLDLLPFTAMSLRAAASSIEAVTTQPPSKPRLMRRLEIGKLNSLLGLPTPLDGMIPAARTRLSQAVDNALPDMNQPAPAAKSDPPGGSAFVKTLTAYCSSATDAIEQR